MTAPTIDFSRLPDVINKAYYPYLWDTRRFNVFYGGAGSGKSVFVAQRYIYRLLTERGRNLLCIRKVDKSNRDSTFALLKQVIIQWGLQGQFHFTQSPMVITCLWNGNQVIFRGLDDVEKIKSITFVSGPLTDIWVEEASEITEADDLQLRMRLRGTAPVAKQITYTFNPIIATHWLKGRFFDFPLSRDRASVLRTTYKDNAWLDLDDRAEIESLKDQDIDFYRVYALGEWGVLGDTIFSNFVIEDFGFTWDDFDAIYQGQDYGFSHPFAHECVGMKDGELYIFDEVYKRQRTNTQLITDVTDYFTPKRVIDRVKRGPITGDSAEPDRIKEWSDAGFKVEAAKKGPDSVRFGIDTLRRHRVHIHASNCPGIAAEFPNYSYRKDKNGNVLEEPIRFKDDGIAALRYALEPAYESIGKKKWASLYAW